MRHLTHRDIPRASRLAAWCVAPRTSRARWRLGCARRWPRVRGAPTPQRGAELFPTSAAKVSARAPRRQTHEYTQRHESAPMVPALRSRCCSLLLVPPAHALQHRASTAVERCTALALKPLGDRYVATRTRSPGALSVVTVQAISARAHDTAPSAQRECGSVRDDRCELRIMSREARLVLAVDSDTFNRFSDDGSVADARRQQAGSTVRAVVAA